MKLGTNKKIIILVLFVQTLSWIFITLSDILEEKKHNDIHDFVIIILPIIIVLLYYFFRRKIYGENTKLLWKTIIFFSLVWILGTAIFAFPICYLVNYNNWIVHQATGGFEYMLNGLEYFVFGISLCIIPLLSFILGELVIMIIHKKKNTTIKDNIPKSVVKKHNKG